MNIKAIVFIKFIYKFIFKILKNVEICRKWFTFLSNCCIIKQMRKKIDIVILKSKNRISKIFIPNNIRLSFYISPLGDISNKIEFTIQDLNSIKLLDENDNINLELFDKPIVTEEGNIYALLEEGVLSNHKTGADLGIYDYGVGEEQKQSKIFDYSKYINGDFSQSIDDIEELNKVSFIEDEDDYDFRHCILAQEGPLNSKSTKVVITFKGYLEVTKGEFSILRKCNDVEDNNFSVVYVPQEYVNKYHLRNGDEIICTCKESCGKMLLNSLFTINQISRYDWNNERPWFKDIKHIKSKYLDSNGEYAKTIINKFNLMEGDNVFMYISKTSSKNQVLSKLMQELSDMFDKVIYLNSQYNVSNLDIDNYNIVKFCTKFNNSINAQATVALLGINYAKRLMEIGNKVAIVVDDMESIIDIDKKLNMEMALSKTLLNTIKVCDNGSVTEFVVVSLRANNISSYSINTLFKSAETIGLVFENNEIDLFNSYRI